MPRPWKRKAVIEDGQLVALKKLIKTGSSYALVIPKDYLRFMCNPDSEGNYWMRVDWGYETGVIKIEGYQGDENA